MSRAQLGRAAALVRRLRVVSVARLLLVRPLAADAIGVVGVEVGAMPAGVGDVVGEAGQPLQGVHGLEVAAERGVHTRAVQHGFPAVEVDELLERKRCSHEVARQVLEGLLVLEGGPPRRPARRSPDASRRREVCVGMPLGQVPGSGDGDDDAGPAVFAESSPDVVGHGLGGALREVEEKLAALPEDPPQEASSSSRCCSTRRKSGDSRARLGL